MANLSTNPSWDNIPQIEIDTLIKGGPGGPANMQAQALANRTMYIKNMIVEPGASVTLNVPVTYPTIAAALTAISAWIISGTVTIQAADGTYTLSSAITVNHPNADRIRIIGNTTTPSNCVLQTSGSDAIYVPWGVRLMEFNGFRLTKIGAKSNIGVLTDGGAFLKLGPALEVDNFYYGIAARNKAKINARGYQDGSGNRFGVKVTNAGDVGIWAFLESYVSCDYAEVSGSNDSANGLGGGIVAEFSSSIQANNVNVHDNWLCGISCLSSSSIRAWNSTSTGNQYGYIASSNGSVEIFNSTVKNNTKYGFQETVGGKVLGWSSCTQSGNDTFSGYPYRKDLEVAEDGSNVSVNTGTLRIGGDAAGSQTGGDSYVDMRFGSTKYGILRAMKGVAGTPGTYTEAGRIQFNGPSNQWEVSNSGTKLRITSTVAQAVGSFQIDGGTGDGSNDVLAGTGKFAIQRYLINGTETIRHQYDGTNGIWSVTGNGKIFMRAYPATGKTTIGVGAPATTATTGHLQIPTHSGIPTGVVTDAHTGFAPVVFDSKTNNLWAYNNGWKKAVAGVGVNVADFGAVGDGVADDTAAFVASLATGKTVYAVGTFKITGSLTITASGQRIIGDGPGQTTIVCSGTQDIFKFSGGVSGQGLENVKIDGTAMTSGNIISVIGTNRVLTRNVVVVNPFNFCYVNTCNVCTLNDVWVNNIRGSYGINWYGTDTQRSDVLSLLHVVMSGNPTASPAGVIMDGNVNTLRMHAVAMVTGGVGLWLKNTSGGAVPMFVYGHDVEIDYPSQEAVRIDAGQHINITGLYAHGSSSADGVYIGANVDTVAINQAKITGHAKNGVNVLGLKVKLSDMHVKANGQSAANTYDGVAVGATASSVTIMGGNIGDPQHKYGVEIVSGARRVTIVGTDLTGNTTGGWVDNSGGGNANVAVIGCGDQTGTVNNIQFSTNGSAPTISPTGASANVDMIMTGKGTGRTRMQKMSVVAESVVSPTVNGDMVFELTSDTTLKVKVKGSDGVVRSATLTLS